MAARHHPPASPGEPPFRHLVFITADTLGRDLVGAYGQRPGVHTPEIDALAASGTRFARCTAAAPTCTPARGAWYSGLHPFQSGADCNNVGFRRGVDLLAERLGRAGWACHHVGKWHLGSGANASGPDGGFDPTTWYDKGEFLDEVGRAGPNRWGGWNRGFEDASCCFGHRVADRAIEQVAVAAAADRPTLLCVEFDEPHGPYIRPPPFRESLRAEACYAPPSLDASLTGKPRLQRELAAWLRAQRADPERRPAYYRAYFECVRFLDHQVGRVVRAVREQLGDAALIVFTADHGDHLGAFGLGPKGPTMYETCIGVPLVISAPGRLAEGAVSDALCSGIDLLPTLLAAAGFADETLPGMDLLPHANDPSRPGHDATFCSYLRFGDSFDQVAGCYPIRCIRRGDWKLVINALDSDECYDLAADPHELHNRIDDPACAAQRDDLHDRLLAWQDARRDPLRGPLWQRRAWRDRRPPLTGLTCTGWNDRWSGDVAFA